MTTFNQATLDQLKDNATATYKNRVHGYDAYAETDPKTLRPIGRMVIAADVIVLVAYQTQLIPTFIEYQAKGYTFKDTIPMVGASAQILLTKPEAPRVEEYLDEEGNTHTREVRIDGVQYQCDELKKILEEVESKYRADCTEADSAATLAEEQRILAEVTAQVDLEIEQERQARIEAAKAARGQRIQDAIKPAKKVTK
jgi:hypothetical protein